MDLGLSCIGAREIRVLALRGKMMFVSSVCRDVSPARMDGCARHFALTSLAPAASVA